MAKTSEAMKQAEKDSGVSAGIPPLTPIPEGIETSFLPSAEHRREEKYSIKSELKKRIFPSPGGEESPWPEKGPAVITGNGESESKGMAAVVEEYRRMKHKILTFDPNNTIKTILFCSSDKGEGKSTVLLHFGQILASEGYRVILVDGNLRRPVLHRLLRAERDYGLGDFQLRGKNLNVTELMKETPLDNLWVITSGFHPNPGAIFEEEAFESQLEQLKAHGDWVLFDSPPLNSCNDAIALAGKVDGIVMVAQAEKTRWEVVQESKARLEKSGGRILGVVLNKRRFHIPGWVYKRL
jgi:capsular exopolysaccharide synthesis family protein